MLLAVEIDELWKVLFLIHVNGGFELQDEDNSFLSRVKIHFWSFDEALSCLIFFIHRSFGWSFTWESNLDVEALMMHWDGKLLSELLRANAVYDNLEDWHISNNIQAMSFDTTCAMPAKVMVPIPYLKINLAPHPWIGCQEIFRASCSRPVKCTHHKALPEVHPSHGAPGNNDVSKDWVKSLISFQETKESFTFSKCSYTHNSSKFQRICREFLGGVCRHSIHSTLIHM